MTFTNRGKLVLDKSLSNNKDGNKYLRINIFKRFTYNFTMNYKIISLSKSANSSRSSVKIER